MAGRNATRLPLTNNPSEETEYTVKNATPKGARSGRNAPRGAESSSRTQPDDLLGEATDRARVGPIGADAIDETSDEGASANDTRRRPGDRALRRDDQELTGPRDLGGGVTGGARGDAGLGMRQERDANRPRKSAGTVEQRLGDNGGAQAFSMTDQDPARPNTPEESLNSGGDLGADSIADTAAEMRRGAERGADEPMPDLSTGGAGEPGEFDNPQTQRSGALDQTADERGNISGPMDTPEAEVLDQAGRSGGGDAWKTHQMVERAEGPSRTDREAAGIDKPETKGNPGGKDIRRDHLDRGR